MKYIYLLLLFLSTSTNSISQPSNSKLKKAGTYQKPWARYQFDVDLLQPNGQHSTYHVFINQKAVLMATMEPLAHKGDLLLIQDTAIYAKPKQILAPIRIGGSGKLASQLYYADLLTLDWQHDYTIQKVASDKSTQYFDLTAKKASAIYSRVELWVDGKTSKPIQSKIYLSSKSLFKQLKFGKEKLLNGKKIITQVKFLNATNKEEATILLKNITPKLKISESYFNSQKLSEVTKLID